MNRRYKMAWVVGCLMGLLILTLPTSATVYAAWLAWEIWRYKGAYLKKSLVPLVLLPMIILAPWTVRNYLIFHRFPLLRDNIGIELSVSNNDCAQFGIRANVESGCFSKFHPNGNVDQARKVLELGEVKYNEMQLGGALHWISSHRAKFIKLSLLRFIAFWMPSETLTVHYAGAGRRLERGLIYLTTLLSLPGLLLLYRKNVTSAAIFASVLAVFPLIYYVIQFEFRYRYPIMWVTFLLGTLPITTCARRLCESSGHVRVYSMAQNAPTTETGSAGNPPWEA